MKPVLTLLSLVLAGCQATAPRPLPLPTSIAEVRPTPVAPPTTAPSSQMLLDHRLKQQRQTIEALMSQNDVLTAKLRASETRPVELAAPVAPTIPIEIPLHSPPPSISPPAPEPPAPTPKPESYFTPNADGVIELIALNMPASEPANPFAVRHTGADAAREVVLTIGGIVTGTAPVALVNGRAVRVGETVESLTLERCDDGAAFFRHGEHRLRLPLTAKPVRIRGIL